MDNVFTAGRDYIAPGMQDLAWGLTQVATPAVLGHLASAATAATSYLPALPGYGDPLALPPVVDSDEEIVRYIHTKENWAGPWESDTKQFEFPQSWSEYRIGSELQPGVEPIALGPGGQEGGGYVDDAKSTMKYLALQHGVPAMNRWMMQYAYPQDDVGMRREAALMQNMTAPNWASRWMEGGSAQLGSKRSKTEHKPEPEVP